MNDFFFKVPFLFEKNNNFFPIITSKWENFLNGYKNIFRKMEYDYKDTTFFWSLLLWFIWWVITFLIIEIIKFLISKLLY